MKNDLENEVNEKKKIKTYNRRMRRPTNHGAVTSMAATHYGFG